MTIKEIKELRVQQEEIKQDNCKESQQALKQLDELEQKTINDLCKKIKKHFKGVRVNVQTTQSLLKVSTKKQDYIVHKYGSTTYEDVTPNLVKIIISEYERVFGELEEPTPFVPYRESIYKGFLDTRWVNQYVINNGGRR